MRIGSYVMAWSVLGIVIIMVLSGFSVAQPGPGDEGTRWDEGQDDGARMGPRPMNQAGMNGTPPGKAVDLNVGPHGFRFSVHANNEGGSKHFNLDFRAFAGLGLRANFATENEDGVNRFGFGILFDELVEFRDNNSNGIFDREDEVVSTYLLHLPRDNSIRENLTWNQSLYKPLVSGFKHVESRQGEKTVHIISTATKDDVFQIVIYITGGRIRMEAGMHIHPLEIKMDFIITDYPYLANDTQLALNLHAMRKAPIDDANDASEPVSIEESEDTYDEEMGLAEDERGLRMFRARERERHGFFTWTNWAIVDGERVQVLSRTSDVTIENQTMTQVSLAYPRGDKIIHDPKVGVSALDEFQEVWDQFSERFFPQGNIPLFMLGIATASVVVAGAYMGRREKKGQRYQSPEAPEYPVQKEPPK